MLHTMWKKCNYFLIYKLWEKEVEMQKFLLVHWWVFSLKTKCGLEFKIYKNAVG